MKINLNTQSYKNDVWFEADLTPKMLQEIQQSDILNIANRLVKKDIQNDFRDNKVVAWCCDKTVQIFEQLNKEFGQKLALPKGIYVENFKNLNVENPLLLGTCNLKLSELRKNSDEAIPSRTLFFNSIHNWDNIDSISDTQYAAKQFSTDHFLYAFLHEFIHASHEDKLLNKFGGKKLAKKLDSLNEVEKLDEYRKKYGEEVKKICNYADNTPLDAIACDMSKVISDVLDNDTLTPTRNPFIGTPYNRKHFWQKTPIDSNPLNNILRNFWNGRFE